MIGKASLAIFCLLITIATSNAPAQQAQDILEHATCKYCNMNRQQYAHSRMLISYDDGTAFGSCSLHCAAVDLALKIDKTPTAIQVGDYYSKELIDAEKAFWVIGGSRPGVMTKRAKWAFRRKKAAKRFIAENGGSPATFSEALKATYEDMHEDSKMIRAKKKIKKMHN